jgi:AmpE protein
MSFLVLLLVLVVEKFSSLRQQIQQDEPFLGLLARLENHPRAATAPWSCLALLVLLPVLALALVLWISAPLAYGWLALPIHLLVLVYSLGRGEVLTRLGPFRDAWRRGDTQAAYLAAQRDLALEAQASDGLLVRVQGYLVWQGYQSFFAVIFWYALLGPLPVLLYRLLALVTERARQAPLRERAEQLRHGLDWLPARVLAGSFALVGNFAAVGRVLLLELLHWEIPASRLLQQSARAACDLLPAPSTPGGVETLDELWHLLVRAAVLWYAGFAVWTLFL